MNIKITHDMLDEFIRKSDEFGVNSPACNEYWMGRQYLPSCPIDMQLSPFSDGYMRQQMNLYREIVGHDYVDARDEFTPGVPKNELIHAPNAYNHPSAEEYAKHYVAVGLLVKELKLKRGARILELGSGWGVCQELLAACGYETVGVDMNPDFVATSNQRLSRLGFGERVKLATFDSVDFESLGEFDAVIAYEAFHHVVDPLGLLKKVEKCIKSAGLFVLAAEPFNCFYKTWGLRLDPYSIYCIRKFGWFESGWSKEFMADVFGRCGFESTFIDLGLSDLTQYMIGRKSNRRFSHQLEMWNPIVSGGVYCDLRTCFIPNTLELSLEDINCRAISLSFSNYNNKPLRVDVSIHDEALSFEFQPGTSLIRVPVSIASVCDKYRLKILSESFSPATNGINSDSRILGISLDFIEWI